MQLEGRGFNKIFLTRAGRAFSVAVVLAAVALLAAAARAQSLLPDPVERALAEVEARSDPEQRWAFTRTYTRSGETIVARYDPRRAAAEEWRLIAPPSEDALSKHQREMLRDIQADSRPMADRTVMITPPDEPAQGLRHLLADLTLVEDGPSGKRYAFQWPEELPAGVDDEHKWLTKHVDGEFAIAADEPWLFSIRLFAPEPFRIAGAIRVSTFEDTTRHGEVEPGGPIAALLNDNHQVGHLFMIRVDDRRVTVNSDFERVEVEGADRPDVE
jgi:hypothetical protein